MVADGTAPDGSPVALYLRLPAEPEASLVADALAPGAAVLDLGCGVGRLAHALRDRGHAVTAVDNSPEMLAHVTGCEIVLADIVGLDLGRRFGGVLLASHLVNDAPERRAAYLRTCRRHLADDGAVVLQRLQPAWAASAMPFISERDGIRCIFSDVRADGSTVGGLITWEFDGTSCGQRFTCVVLDDDALDAALADASLARDRWLDRRHTWVRAVAA